MKRIPIDEDLAYPELIYDGDKDRKRPPFGNFLGIIGIPSRGGLFWQALNGDYGFEESEEEALKQLEEAWKR